VKSNAASVLLASLLFACGERAGAPPAAPRELHYDGSTTISRRVLPEALPLFEARAGARLRVDHGGSGFGLGRLFAGGVDVAGVSRRLSAEELARKPYFQIIGYDALGIWVHESCTVEGLSRAQLKAAFTGAVRTWKALGGKDLPIRLCTEKLGSGRATHEMIQATVMDGAPYGPVQELEDPADCVEWVARTPGGLAAATVTAQVARARAVRVDGLAPSPANIRSSRYLLTRPLLLVTREPPGGPLATLFEVALSPEGQSLVAKAGFVPAR
jgi:phosphate transport system substrate-binding protein